MDPLGLSWDDFEMWIGHIEIPHLQEISDFAAGFGDNISFGITNKIRNWMGTNNYVDKCSKSYTYGDNSGLAFSILSSVISLIPQGLRIGSSQVVTHWGPKGLTALRPGDWVMTGNNSVRNYLFSGVIERGYKLKDVIVVTVPKSQLSFPRGWEWWKGFVGQRIFMPK